MSGPRIIGILGGMGPEATLDLYREILEATPATRDQDHLPVLIYSNPKVPDRTEAILAQGEDPLPILIESARVLHQAGAGILAVPCNTAHYFLPAVAEAVRIPVLDMIRETLRDVRAQLPQSAAVGLLATEGTHRSRIYHSTFEKEGMTVLGPDASDQRRVSEAIQRIKARRFEGVRETLSGVAARLVSSGAGAIILGCTEVPLAFDEGSARVPVFNPTRVLARAAVEWALGRRA